MRKLLTAVACIVLSAALSGCQVGSATVSDREGYFSWVDEQGRVRYSPIVETPSDQAETPSEAAVEDEYTADNYPDAEELRRKGYVREEDGQPYFTWRDADGNVRTSYYQPDTRTDEEKGRVLPSVETTPATVYHADEALLESAPVEGHDPNAFAILGIKDTGDGYLTRFSETCCQTLDVQNHERWQEGREFGVPLKESVPEHPFLTGLSPYQLIALPKEEQRGERVFRLRSYASKGVFVPSVVFLDGQLRPVRLVTDMVSDFEPENWHRRGYLEARISVSNARNERWMLIFTRSDDLAGQTVIDTRRGPRKIPHVKTGEIGLIIVEAQ